MISEEYAYKDVQTYLKDNIDVLITGGFYKDERSTFFDVDWKEWDKTKIQICFVEATNYIICKRYEKNICVFEDAGDVTLFLPRFLSALKLQTKNVLVDITGLHHVIIMILSKVLIRQEKPKAFFAAYVRPQRYMGQNEDFSKTLTSKILGVRAVPGFIKREKGNQLLYSFVGFEGIRLSNVVENLNGVEKVIPIVAFPVGSPHWFNIAMWNSRDLLGDTDVDFTIQKCFSESVFEAVQLLKDIVPKTENIVLAPLGTRPHSMAAAIFACQNSNVRLVHDYAIEAENRTEGISDVIVYHLSAFVEI